MKVLTVKQPFAYQLCLGVKDVENRTWKLPDKYKNEWILIHASKTPYKDVISEATISSYSNNPSMINSAIIGAIKFKKCVVNYNSPWAEKTKITKCDKCTGCLRASMCFDLPCQDYIKESTEKIIYNWIVSEAVMFKDPIKDVKGKLSFWDYPMTREEFYMLMNWDPNKGIIYDLKL